MPTESHLLQSIAALKTTLLLRAPFTEAELLLLLPHLTLRTLKKQELLVAQGAVENQLHYIVEGVTRSFITKDGRDVSFEFYFTGMFISSYTSFLRGTPSGHSIEAFTPLTTLCIRKESLEQLYAQSKTFEQFGRLLTEDLFQQVSERNRDLLTLSATERYIKLLNMHPEYVQAIPLKYLASYLNITPESLSRIRKNL